MDKKVLIQITLLVIIVLILAKIFTFYQSKKGKNLVVKKYFERVSEAQQKIFNNEPISVKKKNKFTKCKIW